MGNCLFGSSLAGEDAGLIKVTTSNGAVMEFHPPISVLCIIDEFPNHGVFKQHDLFWTPLLHHELLSPGEAYYLLPLKSRLHELGHVRSNSLPERTTSSSIVVAPYRMSVDYASKNSVLRRSWNESSRVGFWKVKLVISGEQLAGILAEAGPTEELIDNVRTVAKFGNGLSASAFSDKWSLSSSRSGSKKDSLL
uniref:Uncharacterized protein n=1 Tax=Kalanchoe fedtschenkoi TaxID=63787 RepID=A0A7N1A0Y0_KALFE